MLKVIANQVDTYAPCPVPAAVITDPCWLAGQLQAAARRYRLDRRHPIGVLWWYSASSVLLGPAVDSRDPALDRMTLYLHRDGRLLDARSDTVLDDESTLGRRLAETLSASIEVVSGCSGAPRRALWAIATDSLANRILWAGRTPADARRLAAAVGPELPKPRYTTVSGRPIVRRASCCLIYQAPDQEKCVSCPRQTPETRHRRLCDGG